VGWATVGYCAAVDVVDRCLPKITGVLSYDYCAIVRCSQCFVMASLHYTLLHQLLELVAVYAFVALNVL